jgi:nicotinamidase-related amidase
MRLRRSSTLAPQLKARLGSLNRKSVLLFGIEAHVCVQQTALDLLEQGYDVHLIVDGVSSQRPHDRAVALRVSSRAARVHASPLPLRVIAL